MSNDEVYEHARRRVEAKIGFYIHLAVYVCVNALLIGIDLAFATDGMWFFWPLFGWGIGLVVHGLTVFMFTSGAKVKQRMIDREVDRLDTPHHVPQTVKEDEVDRSL